MTVYIGPIVEGQTEQGCVERLLHRVWNEILIRPERLQVMEPVRGKRADLVDDSGGELIRNAQIALHKLRSKAKKISEAQTVLLILLDAEEDCPALLAPRLLETARAALPEGTSISCVLAKRMFENWIVAGASTLVGVNGLPDPLPPLPGRDQVENMSGDARLDKQIRGLSKNTRKYNKTADADAFVRSMDLQECREKSESFDKFCRELEALKSPS